VSGVSVLLPIVLTIVLGSLNMLILIVSPTSLSFIGSRVATTPMTFQR